MPPKIEPTPLFTLLNNSAAIEILVPPAISPIALITGKMPASSIIKSKATQFNFLEINFFKKSCG